VQFAIQFDDVEKKMKMLTLTKKKEGKRRFFLIWMITGKKKSRFFDFKDFDIFFILPYH